MEYKLPFYELSPEDYGPIQLTGFKDYYKNFFKDLVKNVSELYIINIISKQISGGKKKKIFVDKYSLNILTTIFSEEELEENDILTKYVLTGPEVFIEYTNKFSSSKGIKLEEQMLIFVIEPIQNNIDSLIYIHSMLNVPVKTIDINIIFIPGETPKIIEYMIEMNHLNCFDLYSFSIDIIPIDYDLFSLDNDESFREIYIDKNNSSIEQLANILLKLEVAFGKIKHKYIKGNNAKLFCDLLFNKEEEHNMKSTDETFGMIVLDRSVDFITPFLSNLTFEGLVDDCYGINKGHIKVKRKLFKSHFTDEDKMIKPEQDMVYPLISDMNKFYCHLRCFHYLTVNKYLISIANYTNNLRANKDNIKTTSELNVALTELNKMVHQSSYIKDNMEMLNQIFKIVNDEDYLIKESSILKGISQANSETFYDDYITDKKDLYKILNLMILESLIQNGVKNYAELKKDILAVYGYQNLFLFRNLETLEWIKEKDKISLKKLFKSNFEQLNEKLKLYNEDFILGKTDDLSYVHQGYCPISLRLIEKVGEGGWSEIKDVLPLIPGETYFPSNEYEIANPKQELNTIFLVFLGGITYAEIEGIRYLNRKYKQIYDNSSGENKTRKQFIIITTQILNSKKLLNSLGKDFGSVYTIKKFYDDINKQK